MCEGGRVFDVDICIGASSGEEAIQLVMDKVSDDGEGARLATSRVAGFQLL